MIIKRLSNWFRYFGNIIEPVELAAGAVVVANRILAKNPAGFYLHASDTQGLIVMGQSFISVNNTHGTNGAKKGLIVLGSQKWCKTTGLSKTDEGYPVYVYDSETVCSQAMSTNYVVGGTLLKYDSYTTFGLVQF